MPMRWPRQCSGARSSAEHCLREFVEELFGLPCDLVPGCEHDLVSAASGDAPFLVVVFVVDGIVVPASTVRLEDRSPALEGEVVAISVTVPLEWELAYEVGDPVGDEQAPRLDLQRRSRRVDRIELAERVPQRGNARPSSSTEPVEVGT